jgi:predicted DNA-binding protein
MQVALSTKISYELAQELETFIRETGQVKAHIIEAALKQYLNEAQNSPKTGRK